MTRKSGRRLLVIAAMLAFPFVSRAASAYPAATVTLTGHGYGHGRGMGQYGALGYAVEAATDAAVAFLSKGRQDSARRAAATPG